MTGCADARRIHALADTAFFETLDAQGRSLLRFLHVSD